MALARLPAIPLPKNIITVLIQPIITSTGRRMNRLYMIVTTKCNNLEI